jgi:hypothetical protein
MYISSLCEGVAELRCPEFMGGEGREDGKWGGGG